MSDSEIVSTRLQRIAKLAREAPDMVMTSLNHHLDEEWLREAFLRTRRDGAPGIDGVTWSDYEADLESNLADLLERAKSGLYRAPAVRRAYIPKGSGKEKRPIGIPTLEDKVLQRAVVMLLEPAYEPLFRDSSFGFRPGRSPHQAVQAFWHQTMKMGGGWIIEVDIRRYFDEIPHGQLQEFLRQRVRDGVLVRLIGKWLKAGVMEDDRVTYPEKGSPQGGVISPLLANIYLHHVLDVWFEDVVGPRLAGPSWLIRFADDAVLGFATEEEARRVLDVLPKRFQKYGLTLHPEKTRLVDFRRPDRRSGPPSGKKGETLNFLGFTQYWGKSRKKKWVVKRKTAKDRFTRAIRSISQWCKWVRHWKFRDQYRELVRKVRGHYAYYGVTPNGGALARFLHEVRRVWFKWLNRRSQRRSYNWEAFKQKLKHWPLPQPRVVHKYSWSAAKP